jgi:hypothetical protein
MASHDGAVNIIFGHKSPGWSPVCIKSRKKSKASLRRSNIICCTASMAYRQLARRYRGGLGGHGF